MRKIKVVVVVVVVVVVDVVVDVVVVKLSHFSKSPTLANKKRVRSFAALSIVCNLTVVAFAIAFFF